MDLDIEKGHVLPADISSETLWWYKEGKDATDDENERNTAEKQRDRTGFGRHGILFDWAHSPDFGFQL